MNRQGRASNKFGITNDAPQLKVIINPVPQVKLQSDQLTLLLEEMVGKWKIIDNRTDLSSIGKDPHYSDIRADFNRRLKNMQADPSYSIKNEMEATQAALVPEIPTTGDILLDEMREAEIRSVIRSMNSNERMAIVLTNVEILNAIRNSPVPFSEFPEDLINDSIQRIAEAGKKPQRDRLDDLGEIQKTLDLNFAMAARFIANPSI